MHAYVFCGGKGGNGKTLSAIMWLDQCVNRGRSILAFDANSTNQTLFNLLRRLYAQDKEEQPVNDNLAILQLQNKVWLARHVNKIGTSLASQQLQKLIGDAVAEIGYEPQVILVDTSYNLHELSAPAKGQEFTVWYHWVYETLINPGECNLEEEADDLFVKELAGSYNIVFVLNAFALAQDVGALFSGPVNLNAFNRLMRKNAVAEIGMRVFTHDIAPGLQNMLQSPAMLPQSSVLHVAKELLRRGGRPRNVFCVPAHAGLMNYQNQYYKVESLRQLRDSVFRPIKGAVLDQLSSMDG